MTTNTTTKSRGTRYIADILLGALPLFLVLQLQWFIFFQGALHGHSDFRQLYAAGYMVRTGHAGELYNYAAQKNFQDTLVSRERLALPFIRPAYQAVFFAPVLVAALPECLSRISIRKSDLSWNFVLAITAQNEEPLRSVAMASPWNRPRFFSCGVSPRCRGRIQSSC